MPAAASQAEPRPQAGAVAISDTAGSDRRPRQGGAYRRHDPLPDVSWRILECTEPSWTDPEEEIVQAVRENAEAVTGWKVVVNLRARFSDARFYRHAGVPSVVYRVASTSAGCDLLFQRDHVSCDPTRLGPRRRIDAGQTNFPCDDGSRAPCLHVLRLKSTDNVAKCADTTRRAPGTVSAVLC